MANELVSAAWEMVEHFERVDGDERHKAVIGRMTKALSDHREQLNESVAESILRQLFGGDVQVMLGGNPITCERLERRVQAFFQWKGDESKHDDADAIQAVSAQPVKAGEK